LSPEHATQLESPRRVFDNQHSLNLRELPMRIFAALAIALASLLTSTVAMAQATKPAPRPATPREALKSEAKGLALATETAEAISAVQLDIAARVLTGKADCEYSQSVDVDAVAGQPGVFKVRFKELSYIMVPEETSTGAVRLFDRKAGVVWLQIPVKSMLLNSRAGQRLVDRCMHSEQRAAVAAVEGAARQAAEPAAPRK
jgi:hypothetical protein